MTSLTDFDLPSLQQHLAGHGHRPVHAKAILQSLYRARGKDAFDEPEVGRHLRQWLRTHIRVRQSVVRVRHESIDGTVKLLVGFDAGGAVETVLMPAYRFDRAAACLSSQIGCAMGCDFCASTRGGLQRNLTAGEIVEQFLHVSHEAARCGRRITSLVFMGMGEPLHNLDNVLAAIDRIADPLLGGLGFRAITVSTVGIVPGILRLAESGRPVNLAVSLHAPDDATRSRLVPMNRRFGVRAILTAARSFQERLGRPVNLEYCLLAGVNDSDEQAIRLAELLRGWRVHVNLIPYNWIGGGLSGTVYSRPSPERIERFSGILRDHGVVTHVRITRGDSIAAACGQLRQTATAEQSHAQEHDA